MKTTKYTHDFFPAGKGLVISGNEIILFYKQDQNQFTVWYTYEQYRGLDELKTFLDTINDSVGTGQTGALNEILSDMSDEMLGSIYEEVVGYNPFIENPNGIKSNRELVIDYMTNEEANKYIF